MPQQQLDELKAKIEAKKAKLGAPAGAKNVVERYPEGIGAK